MAYGTLSDRIASKLDSLEIAKKDILTFTKQDLGIDLMPAQAFILKLFYNIPLSDDLEVNSIPIGDKFNETVLHVFTEVQFLDFLYESNRINIKDMKPDQVFIEIAFIIGRRGTKTTMSSIITLYTIYLILLLDNPHKHFQMLEDDEIGVAIVSNNRDGAERQFRTITKMVYRSPFFKKHLVKEPTNGMLFLKSKRIINTKDAQVKKLFSNKGDILISTFAANPNVRGSSNIVTVSDEVAHYLDADVSSKKHPLDQLVFEALTPSTSGFVEADGTPAGKNFFISSPNGERGLLFDIYNSAMKEKGQPTSSLVINVPSHWVNNRIAPEILKAFYRKSSRSYDQEYLAKFVKSTGDWLDPIANYVYAAINAGNTNFLTGHYNPKNVYYLGIDFGVGNDGTAFALCHYEPNRPIDMIYTDGKWEIDEHKLAKDCFIVDHIGYLQPEVGLTLDLDDIMSYLKSIFNAFVVEAGVYDQWAGDIFTQLLAREGFTNLSKMPATQQLNSDQAKLFRQLLMEGRLILPNKPDFIEELFRLKETVNREGLIKVEDRDVHDDQYDAVTRAVWQAYTSIDSTMSSYRARIQRISLSSQKPRQATALIGKSKPNKQISSSKNVRKPGQVSRRR
jgi:hypothetical protein